MLCLGLANKVAKSAGRKMISFEDMAFLSRRENERNIINKFRNMEIRLCNTLKFELIQILPLDFINAWMPALIRWNGKIMDSKLDEACEMYLIMAILSKQKVIATNKLLLASALLMIALKKFGFTCANHKKSHWCRCLDILVGPNAEIKSLAEKIEESIALYVESVVEEYEVTKAKLVDNEDEENLDIPEVIRKYWDVFEALYMSSESVL